MSKHLSARREAGFTFAELAFGLLIFVIAAAVLINHLAVNYQTTMSERDRVFAYSKCQAILAEIQGYVDRGQVSAAVDLDVLDDGVINKPTLSIATDTIGNLVLPDHVLSGNWQRDTQWVWSRRIVVQPFAGLNNRNVRYVTVRLYKMNASGVDAPVADLSSVINSAGDAFPTTQVFDIYLLAVENIPGWWVYMDAIRPFVESTVTDLETRNPGLEIRTHWITKASFGRNQGYRPYINETLDSWQTIPEAYFYPGKMPTGSASVYYYVPANIKARMNQDGTEVNGYDATVNPQPYALADFFNNAVRYPDEVALHQARVAAINQREADIAAAIAAALPPDPELTDMSKEPSLRMLLEELNTDPNKHKNALVINLHGELLPLPSLRNYSDAAKDPENFPEIRVVTHPEELRTKHVAGVADPVRLRVYAYNTNALTYAGPRVLTAPIAVEVMGVDLRHPTSTDPIVAPAIGVENLRGGVTVGGTTDYFPFTASNWESSPPSNPSPPLTDEMHYRVEFIDPGVGQEKFSRIYLYNTPMVAPVVLGKGIWANERSRLYQMEYVPSCTEAAKDFSRDLNTLGDGPKNTARWRITLPEDLFTASMFVDNFGNYYQPPGDVQLQIRTRIWNGPDPANTGTMWPPAARNMPDNLSVTYTWWADSPNDVPITERSQFTGDPRHSPYKDLLNNDPDFPNGYNWYFDTLNNWLENSAADYPGLDAARLRNRWRSGINCDVPRYFELLRKGLVASSCVYTTLTGFSYYYLGVGGDVGYDSANGYPFSIPVEYTPLGAPSAIGYLNLITGTRRFLREGTGGGYWWGRPWLGELYPDTHYASQWMAPDLGGKARGNLTAGLGASRFYQTTQYGAYISSTTQAWGTALYNAYQRTGTEGCTTFFNIGSSASTFHHQFSAGTGSLTATGNEIAANYNFTMPTTAPISRPFNLAINFSGVVGDEWNYAPYSSERHSASLVRTYYDHPSGNTGSGLVQLRNPGNTSAAYVVVNGIDRTVQSGSSFIAKFSLLSLVHSYFEVGSTTMTHRIKQPARVEINSPTDITELNDPITIDLQYDIDWTRWDGLAYTTTGTYAENESELEYSIMYSNDGGMSWLHVQDDTAATPGERPAVAYLVADAGAGPETYTWAVPSGSFPAGSYLVRIDCFRQGAAIHFSYHKVKIYISR